MLRISVVNEPADQWVPMIGRYFRMTLAPLESNLSSLNVRLSAPVRAIDGAAVYRCEVTGRTSTGAALRVSSVHEQGEAAISHAFARARRELRRQRLRTRMSG